jgi:PilZ domain-containing protein
VLLFKSILDTDKEALRPDDKRRMPRYAVGSDFPFKTKLTLFQNGGVKVVDAKGKDWSVTLVNLSATGASVQMSMAAVGYQREACRFKLSRGDYLLEIPAAIAHFRCYSQYSLCGIAFNFPDAEMQRGYLQLLESVIIGSSLIRVAAVQDTPDRHKEQFGGSTSSALTVWRDAPGGQITSFDLRMHRYVVRWLEGSPELEVYGVDSADVSATPKVPPEFVTLTGDQLDEVRSLFSLAVPNLSRSVPDDVRQFLSGLVT